MNYNATIWGAWGAIIVVVLVTTLRLAHVPLEDSLQTGSPYMLVFGGFFWGFVLCLLRDRVRGHG